MAYKITDECTGCAACETECPNTAIAEDGDQYAIDPEKCTECVGYFDEPQCADVCPVECCVPDDAHKEDEAALIEKAKKISPDKDFSGDIPSHFRK